MAHEDHLPQVAADLRLQATVRWVLETVALVTVPQAPTRLLVEWPPVLDQALDVLRAVP